MYASVEETLAEVVESILATVVSAVALIVRASTRPVDAVKNMFDLISSTLLLWLTQATDVLKNMTRDLVTTAVKKIASDRALRNSIRTTTSTSNISISVEDDEESTYFSRDLTQTTTVTINDPGIEGIDNTMLVIHQQYQVFEGEEDEDRSRYTIYNDAMHVLFTMDLSSFRDSSLYRIRMIEILTRRTECPVWERNKIRSFVSYINGRKNKRTITIIIMVSSIDS